MTPPDTFLERRRQTENLAPRPQVAPSGPPPTAGEIARRFFVEHANSDLKAKQEITECIKTFSGRMHLVNDLAKIKVQESARAALAAEDITIDDHAYTVAFERHPSVEDLRGARTHLHAQLVAKLTAESEPVAKRIARAVIAAIGADLTAAENVSTMFEQRYGRGAELAEIRGLLSAVFSNLQNIVERGHDLSVHPRPCHVLAAWFSPSLDLTGFITH